MTVTKLNLNNDLQEFPTKQIKSRKIKQGWHFNYNRDKQ